MENEDLSAYWGRGCGYSHILFPDTKILFAFARIHRSNKSQDINNCKQLFFPPVFRLKRCYEHNNLHHLGIQQQA